MAQIAKPVVKWAGGKRYLLDPITEIIQKIEASSYEYCEPMVGGGAVFFRLHSLFKKATISDLNPDLINLYKVIQVNVNSLIEELTNGKYFYTHKSDPATLANYQAIRSENPQDPVKRAARIIYLLKTCFNGLMRVNLKGQFNVPPGSYRNPVICDSAALRAASGAFSNTTIVGPRDATELIKELSGNYFLFVDPPYHHDGKKFTGYSGKFGDEQQSDLVKAMLAPGCPFIYTNRATEFIVALFDDSGTTLKKIDLRHSIQPKYTTNVVERELIAYRL